MRRPIVTAGLAGVLLAALLLSESGLVRPSGARAAEESLLVREKFERFAIGWMAKLRERERFNRTKIEWRLVRQGVEGTYIGYDTENYRILPLANLEATPIGKLVYLELKFRLAGDDETRARAASPQIVERVEVTELFRYHHGKWVY